MIAPRLSKRCGATDLIDVNEWKTPDARVQRVKDLAGGRGALGLTMGGHVMGLGPTDEVPVAGGA